MRTYTIPVLCLLTLSFVLACEKVPPSRLEISPSGRVLMDRKGETEKLAAMAYDKKNRPWIDKLNTEWTSSDESVVTVDVDGTVTAVGSGDATIQAEAEGVLNSVDAHVVIVGSVEIAEDTPKRLKLLKHDIQLVVVVKDDKGNVIENPQLTFTANDYCVDVNATGFVHPQSVGECSVTVASKGQNDVHTFDVY